MIKQPSPDIFAIIVAGGVGKRLGGPVKKQYLTIADVPVLTRTLLQFDACPFIKNLTLVVPKDDIAYCQEHIIDPYSFLKKVFLTAGGTNRQKSVFNGLQNLLERETPDDNAIVLIHDGVRPFVTQRLIQSAAESAIKHGACIPALPLTDTIKKAQTGKSMVRKTLNRDDLVAVQTPQAFLLSVLLDSFSIALSDDFEGTDDASLVEYMGHDVHIIKGVKNNIKITTREDIEFARFLYSQKEYVGPESNY